MQACSLRCVGGCSQMLDAIKVKPRGGNVRGVPRSDKKRVEELLAIAAVTGIPAAQRDPDMIASLKVPQIGDAPRVADRTVRRRSRVECLARAGVLEPHEAQACEWYAERVALAWDTTGCTANYEGGGSGGGADAPDRAMAKNQEISWARDDCREIRAMLGGTMADAFEAIVCRNEAMGPTAAGAFPQLGRSAAEERLRTTVKFCANKVHERFASLMRWLEAPAAAVTPAAKAPAPVPAPKPAPAPIVDEIAAAIATQPDATALWVSSEVLALLMAAAAPGVQSVEVFGGLPVTERPAWRWGYVIVGCT